MANFRAQVVKWLPPNRVQLSVIQISASWTKSPRLASRPPP